VGAAKITGLAVAVALVAASAPARADDTRCTGKTPAGGRFAICFDPGNRLLLAATTEGYGGGLLLRHIMLFDDEPDLIWKLEHEFLVGRVGGFSDRYDAVLYSGRYLRHARDGHIVLPFAVSKKIFIPFDVGADAQVGRIGGVLGAPTFELGVVRTVALIDISRSEDFKRRLSIGTVVSWDMKVVHDPTNALEDHRIVPFSTGLLNGHFETKSGLTIGDARVEAGKAWSANDGWYSALTAAVTLERVLIAVNDRPVSLFLGGRYENIDEQLYGEVGVRFALFQRQDRRVNLRPIKKPK